MRNVTTAAVLSAMTFLGGCASKANVSAKAPAAHISVAMDEETHRALLGLADLDGDDGPVGTTTLTGADLYIAPPAAKAAAPAIHEALPEERGSLGSLRTWGVAPPTEIDGIPTSRE